MTSTRPHLINMTKVALITGASSGKVLPGYAHSSLTLVPLRDRPCHRDCLVEGKLGYRNHS